MSRLLRYSLFGLIGLVAIGAVFSVGSKPGAKSAAPKAVHLVIDFGEKSGKPTVETEIRSLPIDASGWATLEAARVQVQGTDEYPSGFVCRIQGWPTNSTQDCKTTPASNHGHWAYWIATRTTGSGWMLSGQGAAMHIPNCGDSEGWSWVDSNSTQNPPRIPPSETTCPK
jgi:hypothetical protein